MKGRKGKKGSKNAAKNAANANQQNQAAQPNQGYDQHHDNGDVDNQGDEYFDDEYDDVPPPAPTPVTHNAKSAANGDLVGHPNGTGPPPPNAKGDGKAGVGADGA